jgi:hypothetical protein
MTMSFSIVNMNAEPNLAIREIPQEALDLHYNSGGFLPDVGLYRRGDMFYQEKSHSHRWLFGLMVVGAIIIALLPWHTRAALGELKYWIAGMLVVGALCDIVGSSIQSAVTQHISIDTKKKMLAIVGDGFDRKLSWQQIIGLQICRQKVPGNSEMNGYQLNLVWKEADGVVRRRCLLKHSVRVFVLRLGREYESLFGFALIDHTRPSQPDGATNREEPAGSKTRQTSSATSSGG